MQVDLNAPNAFIRMATLEKMMNLYGGNSTFEKLPALHPDAEKQGLDFLDPKRITAPKMMGHFPNGKAFIIIKICNRELGDAEKSAITICESSRAFIWLTGYSPLSKNTEDSYFIIGETDSKKNFVRAVEKIIHTGKFQWIIRSTLWSGVSYDGLL